MSRSPARTPMRTAGATVDFKTIFWVVVGMTGIAAVLAFVLVLRPPEAQTDALKMAVNTFMGVVEAGFGGVLGLMVGKGHAK